MTISYDTHFKNLEGDASIKEIEKTQGFMGPFNSLFNMITRKDPAAKFIEGRPALASAKEDTRTALVNSICSAFNAYKALEEAEKKAASAKPQDSTAASDATTASDASAVKVESKAETKLKERELASQAERVLLADAIKAFPSKAIVELAEAQKTEDAAKLLSDAAAEALEKEQKAINEAQEKVTKATPVANSNSKDSLSASAPQANSEGGNDQNDALKAAEAELTDLFAKAEPGEAEEAKAEISAAVKALEAAESKLPNEKDLIAAQTAVEIAKAYEEKLKADSDEAKIAVAKAELKAAEEKLEALPENDKDRAAADSVVSEKGKAVTELEAAQAKKSDEAKKIEKEALEKAATAVKEADSKLKEAETAQEAVEKAITKLDEVKAKYETLTAKAEKAKTAFEEAEKANMGLKTANRDLQGLNAEAYPHVSAILDSALRNNRKAFNKAVKSYVDFMSTSEPQYFLPNLGSTDTDELFNKLRETELSGDDLKALTAKSDVEAQAAKPNFDANLGTAFTKLEVHLQAANTLDKHADLAIEKGVEIATASYKADVAKHKAAIKDAKAAIKKEYRSSLKTWWDTFTKYFDYSYEGKKDKDGKVIEQTASQILLAKAESDLKTAQDKLNNISAARGYSHGHYFTQKLKDAVKEKLTKDTKLEDFLKNLTAKAKIGRVEAIKKDVSGKFDRAVTAVHSRLPKMLQWDRTPAAGTTSATKSDKATATATATAQGPETEVKSNSWFGWLKSLFVSASEPTSTTSNDSSATGKSGGGQPTSSTSNDSSSTGVILNNLTVDDTEEEGESPRTAPQSGDSNDEVDSDNGQVTTVEGALKPLISSLLPQPKDVNSTITSDSSGDKEEGKVEDNVESLGEHTSNQLSS